MAQSSIFRFPEFASCEAQARRNLARALIRDWQSLGYLSEADFRRILSG
jgi:hypothetical protein